LIILFWKKILKLPVIQRVEHKIVEFLNGIKSVNNVESKFWFWFHSLFIWVLYFLMLYFAFKAFAFTSGLSIGIAFSIFVISSYGMLAPAPGGIGPWHFMVIQALLIYLVPGYNISDFFSRPDYVIEPLDNAGSFALVVHGIQTLLLILLGFLSLILIPIYNRKRNKEETVKS